MFPVDVHQLAEPLDIARLEGVFDVMAELFDEMEIADHAPDRFLSSRVLFLEDFARGTGVAGKEQ